MAETQDKPKPVRLDKWLWAARFFKTRSLAASAIKAGKIHINGVRAKAGKEIHSGMLLDINLGDYQRNVTVVGLSDRRGPASTAVTLYQETAQSLERNLALRAQRKLLAATGSGPTRKPSKRDRRHIVRFTRRSE